MSSVERWTAAGSGGVAVVVLRGADAAARLATLGVEPPLLPGDELPRGPRWVRLRAAGEDLDEALLIQRASEVFELHLHGSPPLVSRVCGWLRGVPAETGAPVETGGARTRDTEAIREAEEEASKGLEERAWSLLASAPGELGARVLLDQAQGALRRELERLRGAPVEEQRRGVDALLERGRRARFLLRPTRIALCGPVNAGKSTLFNALLGEERALVSAAQGTTRDAVAERAELGPWPVKLVDTAGRRDVVGGGGQGVVERAGQRLARDVAREADWILELRRAGSGEGLGPGPRVQRLWSCCDELPAGPWPVPGIAAREDPDQALGCVRTLFEERFKLPSSRGDVWKAGEAVPFEAHQSEGLRALRQALAGGAQGAGRADQADLADPIAKAFERLLR